MRAADKVRLDQEIVTEEADRLAGVGEDAADGGCGDNHGVGRSLLEEDPRGGLVAKIEFGPRGYDDLRSISGEPPRDRSPD